jgi:hypothetical protein
VLKMDSLIFGIDLSILSVCVGFLIITSIKFFSSSESRDKRVGLGLISIIVALFLGLMLNFYGLYQITYWFLVEIFHIIGIVLIIIGMLGFDRNSSFKAEPDEEIKK